MTVNKVILVGRLGKDPEVRYTSSGTAICKFSLATGGEKKDSDREEQHNKTQWHNIEVWGKAGESCGEYLKKGRQVYIEGEIIYKTWDKDDGTKGYETVIKSWSVKFLGGKRDE